MYFSLDVKLLSKILWFPPCLTLADSSYLLVSQSCSIYSVLIPSTVKRASWHTPVSRLFPPQTHKALWVWGAEWDYQTGHDHVFSKGLQANGGDLFFNSNVEILESVKLLLRLCILY